MEPRSRPFGESAIASEHRVFFFARLRLTAIYVLILAIILVGFSITLYGSLQRNLVDANEDTFAGVESHHHFVQNTLANVESEIMLIDLIVLVAAAGVSYALAGYTLKPIQRSLEAQKAFSENASHELRTPLAVIKNDIEVLLRNAEPTKERIHTTLMNSIEEIDRMSKMTEDLLVLARSENQAILTLEKVSITNVAHAMVEKVRPLARVKSLSLKISSDGPLSVVGSKGGLERVFLNLLQNAIEHTPAGGSIIVDIKAQKSHVMVSVSDTGSGIEEKDLAHIFERFYKGAGASGSGLGLALVKEMVEQHRGSIDIKSAKMKGTIVTLRFPAST